ncbi:MAG: hypothetical protein ACTSV3_03215 [Candidatus Thorarchaeota archaeon]|nr:MAG: hypothetical protein DRP09_01820 [Candidatus Thorarchaeota archaeon]
METPPDRPETPLPFPHGIEVELQVIRRDGTWIRGEEILSVFDKIVSSAKTLLDKKIRSAPIESVKRKYSQSTQTEEGERGSRIVATYTSPAGDNRQYTLLGHDPNVTSLTWILEVATPPCTTLEELAWWIQTLVAISYESLPRDSGAILVSTGLNPTQEYLRNLSFGEHHHILGPDTDEKTKLGIYNLIRAFVPHLIALSVNSPFENKKPSDEITMDREGRVRAPRCKRSIRLFRNTTQMGPTTRFEYIPYLTKSDPDSFAKHVNRSYARMVDMYPFTNYDTIELRVFDTQLSIPRRIGLALLLQALALKARKMVKNGIEIPNIDAASLAANRQSAVSAGLWGPFKRAAVERPSPLLIAYNHKIDDDGTIDPEKRNRFIGDSVISMLYLIKDELEELHALDNPFLQPILVSVFGSEFSEPRTTCADFQLQVYAESDFNMVALLRRLTDITRECSTNWLYDPIGGTPRLPTWLCWWKGLEPEIVTDTERAFAGQTAEFSILLKNSTGRALSDLSLRYVIEDSDRNRIEDNILTVPSIDNGEIHITRVSFVTRPNITAYNVIMEIGFAGRSINLTSTINTYWMRGVIRGATTTQFADGKTPMVFVGRVETNYPEDALVNCELNVVVPSQGIVVATATGAIPITGGNTTHFDQNTLTPLVIPGDASQGVERCILQLRILNQEGDTISEATSKPFYVGFVKQGPQISISVDVDRSYAQGEEIVGEVFLSDKQKAIGTGAKMFVEFVSDSGLVTTIDEFQYGEFVDNSVQFYWRIPFLSDTSPGDRMGVLRARVVDRGRTVASCDSDRFRIEQTEARVSIDSLRTQSRSHIGGKISGWLRVRRNTEQGEPAKLTMAFVFPNGEKKEVLNQSLKRSRNLSVSFGPLEIPRPERSPLPHSVDLVAELSIGGMEVDREIAHISLQPEGEDEAVSMDFIGQPRYVEPDDMVQPTLQVSCSAIEPLQGSIHVILETVSGSKEILSRNLTLEPGGGKMIPLQYRVPLSAEMSTAHLIAAFTSGDVAASKDQRFKIKAIAAPLFTVEFSVRNEDGEEIPGLVARLTTVEIHATVKGPRVGINDLTLRTRVMSRREIVKEFETPLDIVSSTEKTVIMKWLTPPIDMVTGFYLDAALLQGERVLPTRAVDVTKRQFTVY